MHSALKNSPKECRHRNMNTLNPGGRRKAFRCGVKDIMQTLFILILKAISIRLSDMALQLFMFGFGCGMLFLLVLDTNHDE